MRKIIAILILLLLGVGLYLYTGNTMKANNEKIPVTAYNKIMAYDLDKDYPESIEEVLNLNNRIIRYIYGQQDDNKEDNLKDIIIQQRKLYDNEFLENNPLDTMIESLEKEIKDYEDLNKTILGTKMLSPEKVEGDTEQELTKVKVVLYTNTENNIYLVYGLRKTNDKWKILGWKPTKEFVTEE